MMQMQLSDLPAPAPAAFVAHNCAYGKQYDTLWHLHYLQTLEYQRGYARGMIYTLLVLSYNRLSMRQTELFAG